MSQAKFYILSGDELNQVAGGCTHDAIVVDANSSFVNEWHGLGCDHQSGELPGTTAQGRHDFLGDTAGGSNVNPTYNGANG